MAKLIGNTGPATKTYSFYRLAIAVDECGTKISSCEVTLDNHVSG
jgi:hypothetical protein